VDTGTVERTFEEDAVSLKDEATNSARREVLGTGKGGAGG
jgi:hypothetical protein